MLTRIPMVGLLVWGLLAQATLRATVVPAGASPDYLVHAWQTDNGLPQNWVSSLAQTPDGYLWVGTRYGGLARFDGVRFVAFTPQNTPELKDVQVEHLSVDPTGRLWIIMGNESVTSFHAGRFELWRSPRAEPRLRPDRVLNLEGNQVLFSGEFPYLTTLDLSAGTNGWKLLTPGPATVPLPRTFCRDRRGAVWFLTENQGLARYWQGRYETIPGSAGLPEALVSSLALDPERRLWVATPHHLLVWTGEAFEDRTPANGPAPSGILRIAFSGDGGLWVLERDRLRKWRAGRWTAAAAKTFEPERSESSLNLYGDAEGNAWVIGYGHGLWHVKAEGTVRELTEKTGLPSVFITCWFQDRDGNVWVGTTGGGLARIRESLFHVLGPAQGLPGKVVRSVCIDGGGTLWAGTMSGGLARWQEEGFVEVPLPLLTANPVESVTVFPGQGSGLWIGSLNQGLMRLEKGKLRHLNTEGIGSSVRVLFQDHEGHLWVGGLVNLFEYAHGRLNHFGADEGFANGIAIGALAEDAQGALWIGTGPGTLWRMKDRQFTRFNPPVAWPSVRFSALLPDTNGVVWVGTLGGGLLRFKDGQFARYTMAEGLPDNNVTQLLDGGDGNVWAGTYAGIFRVSKADLAAVAAGQASHLACRVYGRFDGLPALECSSGFQPSCWRSKEGQLWFSTANGLVTVDPRAVTGNRRPPAVIIEEMLVDGKARPLPLGSPAPLELPPGRHYVQFRFTGLDFAAPDGVRFRVELEGGKAAWQDTGAQRTIGYGPLMPGDYRLRVQACNSDGVWNEEGASLAFSVLPFYWETWWFRVALALGLCTALALTVALAQRRRYRLRLERLERQQAIERERTRIARDLHDDLGTSLTQISMLSALANREQTAPTEAKEIIQHVRGRAREMVTALDEIVWAVNPKNDSLLELINYLAHFAEEFFRPTGIRCRMEIPADLPEHPLSAELRHHLFLAFKEALNNAARHSGASEVMMRAEVTAAAVTLSVEDNGRGFQAGAEAAGRQGNGARNLRQRLEQIGGRADLRSAPGQGTTVTFYLPLR